MNAPGHLLRPTIPIAYVQLLLELMAERGFATDQLLGGLQLAPEILEKTDARISAHQWTRLIMRALELSQDPGLGYDYGLRMRPTVHGVVGYASMTCTTLRQALEISVRYARMRQAHFSMEIREAGDHCLLVLHEKFSIPVMRSFFYENILLGLARAHGVLLGRDVTDIDGIDIWFDWPEPDYHKEWAARLPQVRFSQACNGIRISAACMNLRPVLADPHASRQAIELCERELTLAVGNDVSMSSKVRAALTPRLHGGYMQLGEVALLLGMSPRSLKRKLQQEGTSFLLVQEAVRRHDAHRLLSDTQLHIQDIAARLGYLNPANFSRAFTRWTGEPPTRYRSQQKTPPI